MDVATSLELLASGEFPQCSIGDNATYAKSTGCPAQITNVERLSDAHKGEP